MALHATELFSEFVQLKVDKANAAHVNRTRQMFAAGAEAGSARDEYPCTGSGPGHVFPGDGESRVHLHATLHSVHLHLQKVSQPTKGLHGGTDLRDSGTRVEYLFVFSSDLKGRVQVCSVW